MTINHIQKTVIIPEELADKRLDQALVTLLPEYSRARLQTWIKSGEIMADGKTLKPKAKVKAGQVIEINAKIKPEAQWKPQQLAVNIIFEDDDIIVVNKPVGLVVHPAAGNPDKTLVNAMLHHAPIVANLPRAGIVHRLDKDTSGLLVIAKSLPAHTSLIRQIQKRSAKREYLAVVYGEMISGGTVDAAIGRHPIIPNKINNGYGPCMKAS